MKIYISDPESIIDNLSCFVEEPTLKHFTVEYKDQYGISLQDYFYAKTQGEAKQNFAARHPNSQLIAIVTNNL